MKIIYIAREVPYPVDTGARMRVWYFLKSLAARHEVELVCYGHETDPVPDEVRAVCGRVVRVPAPAVYRGWQLYLRMLAGLFSRYPYAVASRFSPVLEDQVAEVVRESGADVVMCDSVYLALHVPFGPCPVVLNEHNVESVIIRRYAAVETNFLKRLYAMYEGHRMTRFENSVWRRADRILVCSDVDRDEVLRRVPGRDVVVVPNGVELDKFCNGTRTHGHKDTNTQGHKDTNTQGRKDTNNRDVGRDALGTLDKFCNGTRTQGHKDTNIQGHMDTNNCDLRHETCDMGHETCDPGLSLVYTGLISWKPNEDAVLYFIKEIYPLVKRTLESEDFVGSDAPGGPHQRRAQGSRPTEPVRFIIVGKGPSQEIRDLAAQDPSITVTGFVDAVEPYVRGAAVFVVPLRIGSGTRLKILEAWAMGKAIVSTSVGCEGLDARDGENILIADTPEEFARKTVQLLTDDDLRSRLETGGRKTVEEQYSWDKIGEIIGRAVSF